MSGLPNIQTYALPTSDDLPTNTARWNLNPKKAALLIHDMQRYFLSPFPETIRLLGNSQHIQNYRADPTEIGYLDLKENQSMGTPTIEKFVVFCEPIDEFFVYQTHLESILRH